MITDNKMNELIKIIKLNQYITTKELTDIGFNSHDIKKLIDNNVLYREKRGKFRLNSVNNLYKVSNTEDLTNIIINNIQSNEIDLAISILKEYLTNINKKQYEYLFIMLIKMSVIEKDSSLKYINYYLNKINDKDFKIDINVFVDEFYKSLLNKEFEKSKIFIKIISTYKTGQDKYVIISKLKSRFKGASTDFSEFLSQDEINSYEKFIEEKYKEIKECKVILLDPMDSQERKIIHNMVKRYPDIVTKSIGESKERQIFLRYKPLNKEKININESITLANKAYYTKNYELAIKLFEKMLIIGMPKPFVYAKLGLSYEKLGKTDLAIKYLTIATKLSQEEDKKYDFRGFIENIKMNTGYNIDIKESEFKNQNQEDENFEKVNNYIKEHKLNVESSCSKLGFNEEETCMIMLMYSVKYYMQNHLKKGDEFYKYVEKNKNKTNKVRAMMETIKKNKKLYLNKSNDESPTLSLTIKP